VIVYVGETEFYRSTLGISYELGSRLRRIGVLVADAEMKDGRPLFFAERRIDPKAQSGAQRASVGP
jgi:hypothetical protein